MGEEGRPEQPFSIILMLILGQERCAKHEKKAAVIFNVSSE